MQHISKQFVSVQSSLRNSAQELKEIRKFENGSEPKQHEILAYVGHKFDATDVGNVDRLLAKYGTRIAYTNEEHWIVFNGQYWNKKDGNTQIKGVASEVVRKITDEVQYFEDGKRAARHLNHAQSSGRSAAVKGMIELAQPAVQTSISEFDKKDYLWNAKNGTVDLRTGDLKPFNQDDLITFMGKLDYNPKAECPLFLKTIEEIFCNDHELVKFFKVLMGYAMFGHQEEQIIVFLTGDEKNAKQNGSNGKSMLMGIIEDIFGAYRTTISTKLITEAHKSSGIDNDVAKLAGTRLATGSEFDRNDIINEKRFKQFTGEDYISARFLRKEFFDFRMVALMMFSTNYVPLMQSQDDGLFRRLVEIPFKAKFYEKRYCPPGGKLKDTRLKRKLQAEYEGILAWVIQGAIDYNKNGLNIPDQVYVKREEKKAEVNPLHDFMDMCLERGEEHVEQVGSLYRAYNNFIEQNDGLELSSTAFGRRLNDEVILVDKQLSGRYKHRRGARLNEVGRAYANGLSGLGKLDEMEKSEKIAERVKKFRADPKKVVEIDQKIRAATKAG